MTDHDRHGHNHSDDQSLATNVRIRSGQSASPGQPGHSDHTTHGGHGAGHGDHVGHSDHGAGHGDHGDHVAMFRRLFWIMLALSVPVVALSDMFAMIVGYQLPELPLLGWVPPILGTVMYVIGGRPFLTGAVAEIKARQPGMMLLVGLAITVAFVASWGATLGLLHHELDFWWELALLILIMLLGHWIEMRSLAASASALDSLAALLPDEAELVDGEILRTVSPGDLRAGDVVVVRPGGRIPADGRVVDGSADVDESMITGESRPVTRRPGDQVVAGTVSTDSSLRIMITATGENTALAGIRRLVAQAQASTSRAQLLADRAAGWLFWFALVAALITFVVWSAAGQPESALIRTITVLVIACPHALGLAIPLVVSIATERAARAGILITDRRALEAMRTVDAVLFDKTGTLTRGEPAITGITTVDGVDESSLLAWAAAAEQESEHPLARAVVAAANQRDIAVPTASESTARPGIGVSALVSGNRVQVGGPALLAEAGLAELPRTYEWRTDGATILHVVVDDRAMGALALADEIRPESAAAVDALHRRGIEVVMITGDAPQVAESVGAQLRIDDVLAGVRPEDKGATVAGLQDTGRHVAMVGDGVNDAPALAQADVGIAIGAGTDVAIASAGVVLAGDDPRAVASVIELSDRSYRKMRQNLAWAAGYNLIAVPLAAGILAPIGFVLPMAVGALLMSASTVVVALNAQLLRRLDLRPERVAR